VYFNRKCAGCQQDPQWRARTGPKLRKTARILMYYAAARPPEKKLAPCSTDGCSGR